MITSVPREHEVTWRKVQRYRLGHLKAEAGFRLIDRLVEEYGWTRVFAQKAIREFRRFLLLGIIANCDTRIVPSAPVDDVWHSAMKFTRAYGLMCEKLAGRMLHHRPAISAAEVVELAGSFEQTLEMYRQTFRTEPPADLWPVEGSSWGCMCGTGD